MLPLSSLNLAEEPKDANFITPDQCVAYIKFITALGRLRMNIASQDGIFGLWDEDTAQFGNSNEVLARIREKRWAVYTARAVDRYTKWWDACLPTANPMPTMADMRKSTFGRILRPDNEVVWLEKYLPPLGKLLTYVSIVLRLICHVDVLMVWHSHMLNPWEYLEDCIRHGKVSTWASKFPWEMINRRIDDHTIQYIATEEAQASFESLLALKWDNLDDPLNTMIACPSCNKPITVDWTTRNWIKGSSDIDTAFASCTGLADKSFRVVCPTAHCQLSTDHDRLKLAKLHKDIRALVHEDVSLRGSYYNLNGILTVSSAQQRRKSPLFPSELFKILSLELLAFTDPKQDICRKITNLHSYLETKLRDQATLDRAYREVTVCVIGSPEKKYLNRMLSRYWDTSTPFSLDLVGAVVRQGTFTQHIDHLDWVHSPDIFAIADRLVNKYSVFFSIEKKNPKQMAVPTLDADIAWHTHLLSPAKYYAYSSTATTKPRLFSHDDPVDPWQMHLAFIETSREYRKATSGAIYSECVCWYCATIVQNDLYESSMPSASKGRARKAADALYGQGDISSNACCGPHISAHNAIARSNMSSPARPYERHRPNYQQQMENVRRLTLSRSLEKACQRLQKGKISVNAAAAADLMTAPVSVWGYQVDVGFYAPYMADPGIHADLYAHDPRLQCPELQGKKVINNE
ncbi:hypothetical protein N7474_006609 [Penicillium riverlandense]|uniref:uncharacterized protein n=1 Tax=Penicillium riverlandense TaxID=1903569 RepID=UPI002547E1D3|nr:uncharacterized protein N7474_006609 [Penicillium riverlandense]KAJ5814832.1 hypothetical protein N7474_006609 [Penicillium riverlandense]